MKEIIACIVAMLFCCVIGVVVAVLCVLLDRSFGECGVYAFFVTMMLAILFGVFDGKKHTKVQ